MHCYECARRSVGATAAVALCRGCGAGLCLAHVREEALGSVGGTHIGCGHDTWSTPREAPAPAYAPAPVTQ